MLAAPSSPPVSERSPNFRAHSYRGSPRESPRSFAQASNASPRSTFAQPTVVVAGPDPTKPTTADSGTQYSPPDWPPTDPRSSLNAHKKAHTQEIAAPAALTASVAQEFAPAAGNTADPVPLAEEPPEPQVRITPQSSLQNGSRRHHANIGGGEGDSASAALQKRPRHAGIDKRKLKAMPADYVKCEPKVLASIIAGMLMRLIQHNDTIPLKDGQLTRFHSRAPPGISVHDYLARLTFHATLATPILLSMVFFIDKLSENYPTFIINSLTVHRFLITAATVASKGLSDSFWTNSTYARVGGVSVKELALLELELLIKCDWVIIPSADRLVAYYNGLVEQSDEWYIEGQEDSELEPRVRSTDVREVLPNARVAAEDSEDPDYMVVDKAASANTSPQTTPMDT